jgi:hypothetical protein
MRQPQGERLRCARLREAQQALAASGARACSRQLLPGTTRLLALCRACHRRTRAYTPASASTHTECGAAWSARNPAGCPEPCGARHLAEDDLALLVVHGLQRLRHDLLVLLRARVRACAILRVTRHSGARRRAQRACSTRKGPAATGAPRQASRPHSLHSNARRKTRAASLACGGVAAGARAPGGPHQRQHGQHGHRRDERALLCAQLLHVRALDGRIHAPLHDPELAVGRREHGGRARRAVQQRQLAERAAGSRVRVRLWPSPNTMRTARQSGALRSQAAGCGRAAACLLAAASLTV